MVYNLFKNKGRVVIDNTPEFLNFCKNSNGLVFWGPYGSGKTALMALLAHELPEENKYASFPCNLPWMERAQVDFAHQPTASLGVKEVVFLDEINLLFRGNEFQKAQQMQRFLSHFFALSRHQGTKIFINGQRLGQVWIELREVATAVCNVSLLQKIEEGIYVQVEIWQAKGKLKRVEPNIIRSNSIKALLHGLSEEKLELFSTLVEKKPNSLEKLADYLHRDYQNVKKDAEILASWGIIELQEEKPIALYEKITLEFPTYQEPVVVNEKRREIHA
ncbi:17188_t:CDS:2 [Racocetra fulgida]|uniref:17188_t:CDS:1 n=1 Tax=Racocetra fulgida TaxID=60492 RepID=A0A9N9N8Y7_9GLOM|nr:17188_t:CDS:2 [Racocetra fulgida]